MLKPERIKRLLAREENILPLCIAAFIQSCGGGVWFVSMPFIMKRLGGTDTQLGLLMALWFASYTIGCISAVSVLDRFRTKSIVILGAIINILMNLGMLFVVFLAQSNQHLAGAPSILIGLSFVGGFFVSLFWPPLMGWVSTGYEGKKLNKRLGLFNVSWSFGGLVTPYFAGLVVEQSSIWAFVMILFCSTMALAAVLFAKNPDTANNKTDVLVQLPEDVAVELLPKFKWMARIALWSSFACVALLRTQFAVLFKYELSYSESEYGAVIMMFSLAVFVVFSLAGRTHAWHYKLWPFFLFQCLQLCGMVLILNMTSLFFLTVAVVVIGIGNSFVYSSHIYYGVSGSKNRTGRMAIHETILSIGFSIGCVVGGMLGDHFSRYSPYIFGFGIVFAGMAAQTLIWFSFKQKSLK